MFGDQCRRVQICSEVTPTRRTSISKAGEHYLTLGFQRNLVAEGLERMRIEDVVGAVRQLEVGIVDEGLAPDRER
jgi:hypothetical protein